MGEGVGDSKGLVIVVRNRAYMISDTRLERGMLTHTDDIHPVGPPAVMLSHDLV